MIRWGIAGAGNIAHSFANDLSLVKENRLVGVGSRSLEKAQHFAREYDAAYAHGSYEDLFKSNEIDVVYIATPHTFHAEMSILAMEHKKHVLCEKPLGVNIGQVNAMLACARENGVFIMEALWSRFNPAIIKIKELVDNGEIGEVAYLNADFTFYGLDRDEKSRVLNPDLAGGSLLDIGIYPIFLSYLLLGMPKEITARANFFKTGVEIQTAMIFEYERAQAMLYSGLNSNSEVKAKIVGSKGAIHIKPRWHEATGILLEKDGEIQDLEIGKQGKGYTYEIKEVQKCLENGKLESGLWSHQNSRDLCTLLDTVREKSGIKFPFER
ncbi:Gfo/Idh/MocA family protein [Maribacter sp. 2304DJ31-5]|uniref:Gfo/Idh/MocA family protein n=1 Tax=Maribacter sp. 2304DJ31-5 TaxID=3386273 RepID=UPI0039BC4B67